ncbi:hypothetical protein [Thermodesulfovibrio hydrogeniphilus]
MIDTYSIYKELSSTLGEAAAKSLTEILAKIHEELIQTVTKSDFEELSKKVELISSIQFNIEKNLEKLTQRVNELAEAQKKTEERLNELAEAQKKTEERLNELAEAQKASEQRLTRLEQTVAELAEAQKASEQRLTRLEQTVAELAEAQKASEQRLTRLEQTVAELAEAQKKTEERLNELAEAQKKTEESLNRLIKRVDHIEQELGGISMVVGYGLEDKLYPHINVFVRKVFNAEPLKTVLRKHIEFETKKYIEANIYTEAKLDGKQVLAIGECKAQPGKKDIDRFMILCKKISEKTHKEILPYIVGFTFTPVIEEYIKEKYPELKFFRTYEIENRLF